MTIKQKLTGLVIIVLVAIAALFGLLRYATQTADNLKTIEVELGMLEASQLRLNRYQQSFIDQLNPDDEARFRDTHHQLDASLEKISQHMQASGIDSRAIRQLEQRFDDYVNSFDQVATLLGQIGLTEKDGLRGSLRNAVHQAEALVSQEDNARLLVEVLQLRRNEKDFIIRKDAKYLETFNTSFTRAMAVIDSSFFADAQTQEQIKSSMMRYQTDFRNLVSAYQALGFDQQQGLIGQLNSQLSASLAALQEQGVSLRQQVEQRLSRLQNIAAVVALLVALAVVLLATLIARSVLQPINGLAALMKQVREQRDLNIRFISSGQDEVARMGQDFNEMMAAFQDLIGQVSHSAKRLADASQRLSVTSGKTAQGLETQQHEVVQVVSAVHEMECAMHEIAGNTETTASAAQGALDRSSEGKQTITQLIATVENLAQQARETDAVVQSLKSDSEQIGSVLDVIKSIAEQTNLLALNASIEAARAGDHGRGFAVVADEVRSLAARTQESASEIETMITGLQSRTGHVSSLMSNSVSNSERSAEEANRSIDALEHITEGAATIVDMTTQVASATEEQAAVAAEINKNIEHIREIIGEAGEQTQLSAGTSQEVAREAMELQQAVVQFKV